MNFRYFVTIFSVLFLLSCANTTNDRFAKCLTDKGVVMYGADWCKSCQNQKKFFGQSFQYINYVNCDFNEATCNQLGITIYPVWSIENTLYAGIQTLENLAELSACENT